MAGLDHVEGEVQAIHENLEDSHATRPARLDGWSNPRGGRTISKLSISHRFSGEASRFVSTITNGRYSGLGVDGASRETQLLVLHPDEISPKPLLPETSRGTREQIHLALRLALPNISAATLRFLCSWMSSSSDLGSR